MGNGSNNNNLSAETRDQIIVINDENNNYKNKFRLKSLFCCGNREQIYEDIDDRIISEREIQIKEKLDKLIVEKKLKELSKETKIEELEIKNLWNNSLIDSNEEIKSIDPYLVNLLRKNKNFKLDLNIDPKSLTNDELLYNIFEPRNLFNIILDWLDDHNFCDLYKKDNLYARYNKNGSFLSKNNYLGYHQHTMDITGLDSVDNNVVINILTNPEYRNWDKNIKKFEILKGINEKFYIERKHFESPIFFISERDKVDKTLLFDLKDDSGVVTTFYINSSVPDGEFYPLVDKVVRIQVFISIFLIRIEEKEEKGIKTKTLHTSGFIQVDPKILLPEWIFNITIPSKSKEYYNNVKKTLEIYEKEGYEGLKIKIAKNEIEES